MVETNTPAVCLQIKLWHITVWPTTSWLDSDLDYLTGSDDSSQWWSSLWPVVARTTVLSFSEPSWSDPSLCSFPSTVLNKKDNCMQWWRWVTPANSEQGRKRLSQAHTAKSICVVTLMRLILMTDGQNGYWWPVVAINSSSSKWRYLYCMVIHIYIVTSEKPPHESLKNF